VCVSAGLNAPVNYAGAAVRLGAAIDRNRSCVRCVESGCLRSRLPARLTVVEIGAVRWRLVLVGLGGDWPRKGVQHLLPCDDGPPPSAGRVPTRYCSSISQSDGGSRTASAWSFQSQLRNTGRGSLALRFGVKWHLIHACKLCHVSRQVHASGASVSTSTMTLHRPWASLLCGAFRELGRGVTACNSRLGCAGLPVEWKGAAGVPIWLTPTDVLPWID
jgi:hypothetical protein